MEPDIWGAVHLRILVAGCDPVMEQGAASLLAHLPHWSVQFHSLDECQVPFKPLPHVALIVAHQFALQEIRCVRRLKANRIKVVVYGLSPSITNLRQVITTGADGFVCAGTALHELLATIEACASGRRVVVTGDETRQLISTLQAEIPPKTGRIEITTREQEVMSLVAQGLTNDEIATQLQITVGTVKVHVAHLLRKHGLERRTQLAVAAARLLAK